MTRIYLDNAATSWPKPEAVYAAMDHYQRNLGAPAGRGVYREAIEVDRRIEQARFALARLIDAPRSDRVIFTYSGTDSLTLALRGLLRPGDHVVTTVCEHNAVLRTLRFLEDRGELAVTRVGCDADGFVDPAQIEAALTPSTRLVAVIHASNVTGAIQPVAEIAERCRHHPALLLVDAAQTIGHVPLSVQQLGCDLLAAPGHKGLLGPTGTGFLYLRPGVESQVVPVRLGGTGTHSESDLPPRDCPTGYEAGNLNAAGLLGLAAGLEYLQQRTVEAITEHESRLTQCLLQGLAQLNSAKVYGPGAGDPRRLGVISFNLSDHDPQEVALLLDQVASINVRAGFQCAPLMHRALQSDALGGTVRVSLGSFNQLSDVDRLIQALGELG